MISRQRVSQKRHPERHLARRAIYKKVKRGLYPSPKTLSCVDCSNQAESYDHAKGYLGDNRYYVEAVCWLCHRKRGKERGEYRKITPPLTSIFFNVTLILD